jgi:hypothetical protein
MRAQQSREKLKPPPASAGQRESKSAVSHEASGGPASTKQGSPAAPQVARIAHDFNNILTLVLGYAENLLRSLPNDHPGRTFAEEICRAARDGEQLSIELASLTQSARTENATSAAR